MNSIVLLIPHYNDCQGLEKSLKSIDKNEFIDVVVIDDGSKNIPIDEALCNVAFKAIGKIIYIYLKENQGIEAALNKGLEYIYSNKNYKYIARLDCGDLCVGKRFLIQYKFLEANPQIKLVGCNARAVDINGNFLYNIIHPKTTKEIRKKMYLNSMFVHPGVMFRKEMIELVGKYPIEYKSAEDYAYFFKFVRNYEVANINEFLVQKEISPTSISVTKRKQQVKNRIRIIWDNFYFGFYPVYGVIRSVILYILPPNLLLYVKKILHNEKTD